MHRAASHIRFRYLYSENTVGTVATVFIVFLNSYSAIRLSCRKCGEINNNPPPVCGWVNHLGV